MKKLLPLLLLLPALALGFFFYSYTFLEKELYPRDLTELTLQGETLPDTAQLQKFRQLQTLDVRQLSITPEQYVALCSALPDCRILWSVPFQGSVYGEDTTDLSISILSESDIPLLAYLPALQCIDARDCRDYEALMALRSARPDLQISYSVSINGESYRENTSALTLENVSTEELLAALPYLPELKTVTFTGTMPLAEAVSQMMQLRPDITYVWDFTVCGVKTSSLARELILSDIPMESSAQVDAFLPYFYNLERVEMCNCGISNEDMDALCKKYPDTRFVWTVKIGRSSLRTDATSFIPILHGYSANAVIRDPKKDAYNRLFDEDCVNFKYCIDMICLDLGHMGITDYSFVANMPNLKYLILADTQGSDFSPLQGLTDLVFLELFMTKFDQAELLPSLTGLRDLNLGFTTLTNTDPLKEMPWLERLWLPGTHLPAEVYQELRTALPNTRVDYAGRHSTDRGWRKGYLYYEMRDALGMYYLS